MLFETLESMVLKILNGINGSTFAFVIMACGVMFLLYDFFSFDQKIKISSSQEIYSVKTKVETQKSQYKEVHFKVINHSFSNN